MERPKDLPDFAQPPLDEVVVGVQFSSIPGYTSTQVKDVWELYKSEFPKVQEHPLLDPVFETFGGSNPQQNGMQFRFGPPPIRSRLWFISDKADHLIQFQEDRLLLNWRKGPNGNEYPRFEGIARSFESHLCSLQKYVEGSLQTSLDINQAEVSYTNIIKVEKYAEISDWFKCIGFEGINLENLNTSFTEVVENESGKPFARLIHEIQSVVTTDGKVKAYKFSLTFRGQPFGNKIIDALDFINAGREKIVTRFAELTSEQAHVKWEIRK